MTMRSDKALCIGARTGLLCIICGIVIILMRVAMWVVFDRHMPDDWGGKFLVGTGAGLFSLFFGIRSDSTSNLIKAIRGGRS